MQDAGTGTGTGLADAAVPRPSRRWLLGVPLGWLGARSLAPARAEAGLDVSPWLLGGTPAVAGNGTNFLGPLNVAPLIFKTRPNATTPVTERMRLTPAGLLGIGTVAPTARVHAVAAAGAPVGVLGVGADGVVGTSSTEDGRGVSGSGGTYGVRGSGGATAGVRGDSAYVGTWGGGGAYGVYGQATATTGQNFGGFFATASPEGYALYADGRAHVAGTLSKAAGSFLIDHPLDPDHRLLAHSFVESPDMLNVYDGNVVLDEDGTATVLLPDYFGALNRDLRYQLTCIGRAAPVYVADEVQDNRFRIAGGVAGLKVSWQVTGVRQDEYALAHPIVVEQDKRDAEVGQRVNAGRLAPGAQDEAPDQAPD